METYLPEIAKKELIQNKPLSLEQEEVRHKLIDLLKAARFADVYKAIEIIQEQGHDIVHSCPEIRQLIDNVFIDDLGRGILGCSSVDILKKEGLISDDFLRSDEVQQAAKRGLARTMCNPHIFGAGKDFDFFKELPLREDIVDDAIFESIKLLVSQNNTYTDDNLKKCLNIKNKFPSAEKILHLAEIKSLAVNTLSQYFSIERAEMIKGIFDLSGEDLRVASEERLKSYLRGGNLEEIFKLNNFCGISEKFLCSNQLIDTLRNGEAMISMGGLMLLAELKKNIKIPEHILKSVIEEVFVCELRAGSLKNVLKIKDEFGEFENIFDSSIVNSAAEEGLAVLLKKEDLEGAIKLKENLPFLPKEAIESAAQKGAELALARGQLDIVLKIKTVFEVTYSNEIIASVVRYFVSEITTGHILKAEKMALNFPEGESEFRKAALDKFKKCLEVWDMEGATEIKNAFNIKISLAEIVVEFPGVEKIIKELSLLDTESRINFEDENILIQLIPLESNPEYFISQIKQNPFLFDAIIANKQHGVKLLLKFPEFDWIAQENIKFLYESKEEILKNQPEIDPNSAEFRHLIEKKLLAFSNNLNIVKSLKSSGVDLGGWLDFNYERHFDLGEMGEIAFSEQIKIPIKRIDESVNRYISQISKTLGEYKQELLATMIASDRKVVLEENLIKMQNQLELATQSADELKISGINKGIESLEKQISQIKPVSVWDKVIGEINKLQLSGNELSKSYVKLCELEDEQKSIGNVRKSQLEQKEKIKQQEVVIKDKILIFDSSFTSFNLMFDGVLKQSLGDERADSMLQEIKLLIGEDLEHYQLDINSIGDLFKTQSNSFDKTPMRIAVASRNPDVDLYLGNYAPCCIRIDSDLHGSESPIADYLTDLGMQNVVIYDEKRQKPMAAAWCFVGGGNNGEPVLVIDNIEADTDYSLRFRVQLERELGDYIQKFAKTAKIKKILQGPYNNDLEVAPLGEIDYKLGGMNRQSGYYLESEKEYDEEEQMEYNPYEDGNMIGDDQEDGYADKYGEYDSERGEFLRGNRARKTFKDKP